MCLIKYIISRDCNRFKKYSFWFFTKHAPNAYIIVSRFSMLYTIEYRLSNLAKSMLEINRKRQNFEVLCILK
jgi:hypothetical protein